MIEKFAKQIERIENMKKNYPKHFNPGALRWSKFQTGNKKGYSTFATYRDGFRALMFQLIIAVNGKSKVYSPEDTLIEFFKKYAPSKDGNNPVRYAGDVAEALGIGICTKLKELANQDELASISKKWQI